MKKAKGKRKSKYIVGLAILVLLALIFIPIEVTYPVTEPTLVQKPLSYRVINAYSSGGLSGLNWVTNGYVEIENTDSEPGTFVVNCSFRTVDRILTDSDRVYIIPGETKKASCQVDTKWGEDVRFTYDVMPGTKSVIEMTTVTKKKTVRLFQIIFGLY